MMRKNFSPRLHHSRFYKHERSPSTLRFFPLSSSCCCVFVAALEEEEEGEDASPSVPVFTRFRALLRAICIHAQLRERKYIGSAHAHSVDQDTYVYDKKAKRQRWKIEPQQRGKVVLDLKPFPPLCYVAAVVYMIIYCILCLHVVLCCRLLLAMRYLQLMTSTLFIQNSGYVSNFFRNPHLVGAHRHYGT